MQEKTVPVWKTVLVVMLFLFGFLAVPYWCPAAEHQDSGCIVYARQWIEQLDRIQRHDVLDRNTRTDCEFAARWISKNSESTSETTWNRTCTDLVLIWTHKKCIYYRDYVDHNSYQPCKEWTRQMYQHCISREVSWFDK